MATHKNPAQIACKPAPGVPFDSAEQAWFWFIRAQQARSDGARYAAGLGHVLRPCEPLDILKVLDRLHRMRRLQRDHLLVLRHYGRRGFAPDSRRVKEVRAHGLWTEALARLSPALEKKGIVRPAPAPANWFQQALFIEGVAAE